MKDLNKNKDDRISSRSAVFSGKKTEKNKIIDSKISAKGNVNIGDTIYMYGMEISKTDIKKVIWIYLALVSVFAILTVVFLFVPKVVNKLPEELIFSLIAGTFTTLFSFFLVIFFNSLKSSPPSKTQSNEI